MKKHFIFFWCFLVDFTKISKIFKIYFFPEGIFSFFSSRLVFPEFFFSINAFLVQKKLSFKILRNSPDKKIILRNRPKKHQKKKKMFFQFFPRGWFFQNFFLVKTLLVPTFPPHLSRVVFVIFVVIFMILG